MDKLIPENVQDYPRPPRLEAVAQPLEVHLRGALVLRTTRAPRVLETHHAPTYYIPPEDVVADLRPIRRNSLCEWKGRAAYFDVHAGGHVARAAAWSYPAPTRPFRALAGYLSVYAGAMDACFVGGERVIPQPGDFYGGWVTANLQGRVKDAAGTEYW